MSVNTNNHGSTSPTKNGEFILDCKAAYLTSFNSVQECITTRKDLVKVLQQSGRNPTSRMISKYWTQDTKSLNFDEFCDICKKEPCTTSEDLMKAFRRIDLNNDGYLSLQELYKMMTETDKNISLNEVKEMLDGVDENKDGRLDYNEFCKMIISTSEDCKKMSRKLMERKEKRLDKQNQLKQDMLSDAPKKMPRRKSKSPSNDIQVPDNPASRDKCQIKRKGCFFAEEDNCITSHWFTFRLSEKCSVQFSIQSLQPYIQGKPKVDCHLFVLSAENNQRVVGFTKTSDPNNLYCDLSPGKYMLIPYTTGCVLRCRSSSPPSQIQLIKKHKSSNGYSLTRQFRTALEEIFDLCDLDDNGYLSKEEFNLYNLRTSGEELEENEWRVVEENVELHKGEITKDGFVQLHQMEVDDNEGDTEDSWLTLSNMGYNRALELDEACPFLIHVMTDKDVGLAIVAQSLEISSSSVLQKAMLQAALNSDTMKKIKVTNNVKLYVNKLTSWGYVVADNRSSKKLKLKLDCNDSKNCLSSLPTLSDTFILPATSSMVCASFVKDRDNQPWLISAEAMIIS